MRNFQKDFPEFSNFFNFDEFNDVQVKCYRPLTKDRRNMVVSAPTSSGKTVIFQIAIINQQKHEDLKCLYLAPIKSLCHQKSASWQKKFRNKLKIFELTSDTSQEQENIQELSSVNLVIATPEKIDSFSRKSLQYLSKINLLLVDEVHMLNFQQRGATLQAVVSRIMSINNPRIIAVSATIPNLKQVAQWLRAPEDMTFLFGQQCRPVKIQKVVLGFKSSNNPYTFQRVLNYKLIDVIRNYSRDRGVLVFCQTQKGTQMACQQIITDMRERQFIDSDQTLMALIQGSKRASNSTLQVMLPQGVAFHNAGLSLQDRLLVQKLFLQNRIRILCTTSTLAMGINLPARLVIIKSTQCYRGAGKGYQQYTQIEMDQMMGRAGRPPFDKQGTVVIMTEKSNYNKYLNAGKLQTLQSHLYGQLSEHINAQISLKSINSFADVLKYFMNSFCFIRMKNSPGIYGIKGNVQTYVQKLCMQSIKKLNAYNLISFYPNNQAIIPKPLGVNVAKNSIQIQTIVKIVDEIPKIKSQRDFLSILCQSQQIKKYRNKLDERKILKQINQKNKYFLKNAISTSQKKCYVLVQSELDGRYVQNWELRKQSKQIVYFLRRLTFCVKTVCYDLKLFWPYYWSCIFNKYFTLKFWERNQQMAIRQFPQLNQSWKMISAKGFKNIKHLLENLQYLDTVCQKNSAFSQNIAKKIQNLKQCVCLKIQKNIHQQSSQVPRQVDEDRSQNIQDFNEQKPTFSNPKDVLISLNFIGFFDQNFKFVTIVVSQGSQLYTIRTLRENCRQTNIAINSTKIYNIAFIKNVYIGFDQFYQISYGKGIKPVENVSNFIDFQSEDTLNKCHKQKHKQMNEHEPENSMKSKSQQKTASNLSFQNKEKDLSSKPVARERKNKKRINSSQILNAASHKKDKDSLQKSKILKKIVPKKYEKINSRRKKIQQQIMQESNTGPMMQAGSYIPLNKYKCWKPGFRQFQEQSQNSVNNRLTIHKPLMIVDEGSSKSKPSLQSQFNNMPTVKSKNHIPWQKYAYADATKQNQQKKEQQKKNKNAAKIQKEVISSNPYDYFLNLFGN